VRIILLSLLLLVGCSSSSGGPNPGQKVLPSASVYIVPVPDATDTDGDLVAGSGQATVASLKEALRNKGIHISNAQGGYALKATITHWEHHATEWNGMPDVIEVSAELSDGEGLIAIAKSRITGSALMLVHAMPDRLLPDAAADIVSRLYGN